MTNPQLTLSQLVQERRQARGLSKLQLATAIGAKDSTIFRIENGQIAHPRGDILRALSEALELPLADVFAAAGYAVPAELPSFRPYLRTKYGELPPEALAELEQTFTDLARKYGTDGPRPGEDEY